MNMEPLALLCSATVAILSIILSYFYFYLKKQYDSEVNFDRDYLIRQCKASDLKAIKEICCEVYFGCDFLPHYFLRYLKNKSYILYGIECRKTNKIVATQLIYIHDGGIKGLLKGARTHKNHRRKGLMTKLNSFSIKDTKQKYPKITAWEVTLYSSNISIKLSTKQQMKIVSDMKYTFAVITKLELPKTGAPWLKDDEFNVRLNDIDLNMDKESTVNNYEYMDDAHEIIQLMSLKYHQKAIYFNWQLFKITDLNDTDCIEDVKIFLKKEINEKRLYCMINKSKTILCLINVDERPMPQLHFYHTKHIQSVALISMIKYLFDEWNENCSKLYRDKTFLRIFMDQSFVDNDENLSKLFYGFDSVYVCNTSPTYYS